MTTALQLLENMVDSYKIYLQVVLYILVNIPICYIPRKHKQHQFVLQLKKRI